MLAEVRRYVLPTMQKQGPVVAWIVDDTGFPKQGKHSVGVARQYCGQVGKLDNCQVAVSLSVSTWNASLPIAWWLYLPEVWCQDTKRCQQAGVPEGVEFQTKPEIALQQIRQALQQQVPMGVVLADAGYGHNTARFAKGCPTVPLFESFFSALRAPDALTASRQWSALSFSPVLITEHSKLAGLVVAQHVRTQEPWRAIVPSGHRPVLSRRRADQAVDLL
jgi:hypothetical protein